MARRAATATVTATATARPCAFAVLPLRLAAAVALAMAALVAAATVLVSLVSHGALAQPPPPNSLPVYEAIDLMTNSHPNIATTCALLADGTAKCFGSNSAGSTFYPTRVNIGLFPEDIGDNLRQTPMGTNATVVSLSSAYYLTCAALSTGGVKCWGTPFRRHLAQPVARGYGVREMGDALPDRAQLGSVVGREASECWLSCGLRRRGGRRRLAINATSNVDPSQVFWRKRHGYLGSR